MILSKNIQQDQYNLLSSEAIANPYPIYELLRTEDPMHWSNLFNGTWVITRYADIVATFNDRQLMNPFEKALPILGFAFPKHDKFRVLLQKVFTRKAIENLRPDVTKITDDLIDKVQEAGRMDIMGDIAVPLPITTITRMLGLSPEYIDRIHKWTDDLIEFMGCVKITPEILRYTQKSTQELGNYLRSEIKQHRQNPQDDMLSHLICAEHQGEVFSEDELVGTSVFLIAAGHATTTNLIGNGLLTLLRHPEQMQQLKDDPSLITSAVEELLRYESPSQWTSRIVEEEFELHGQQIRRNQHILLVLGAANRDPDQFEEPDRLNIKRQKNKHLAFAYGNYSCLGAALARMEGQISINTMLRRLPYLRLETETLEWVENSAFRKLKSLPVVF